MPARNRQSAGSHHYDWAHQQQRAPLVKAAIGTHCPIQLPGCDRVMADPSRMDADHVPPLATHTHRAGTGCCTLVITCRHCNRSKGATQGNRQRGRRAAQVVPVQRASPLAW